MKKPWLGVLFMLLLAGCGDNEIRTNAPPGGSAGRTPDPGGVEEPPPALEISGEPRTVVRVGDTYRFEPTVAHADPDTLKFSIEGHPDWTTYDEEDGILQGIPTDADLGPSDQIFLTAYEEDGTSTPLRYATLPPFRITVGVPWSPLQDLPVALSESDAVALQEKDIYLVGGRSIGSVEHRLWRYDSGTGWTDTGPLPGKERIGTAAVSLGNTLMVLGGFVQDPNFYDRSETWDAVYEYNPVGPAWTERAPLVEPRWIFDACRVGDRVYAIGGRRETGILGSMESYDSAADVWSLESAVLNYPRQRHDCAVLNERIYVVGGEGASGDRTPLPMEVYDPAVPEEGWVAIPGSALPDSFGAAVQVLDEKIYLFGGLRSTGEASNLVRIFDPESQTWSEKGRAMLGQRAFASAFLAADSNIMVAGGRASENVLSTTKEVDLYAPVFDYDE